MTMNRSLGLYDQDLVALAKKLVNRSHDYENQAWMMPPHDRLVAAQAIATIALVERVDQLLELLAGKDSR